MAGQFGPGTLGNANAIEPRRPDYITLMDRAGGAERALVEEGMRNRDPACQMSIDVLGPVGIYRELITAAAR
jgi:hypothetical protein